MNPVDPLASLQPLREPLAVGWWPLAPGWWILLGLALCLLAAALWWLWRRYRANAYRRQAVALLDAMFQHYREEGSAEQLLAELNVLLKTVALGSYPAAIVAGQSGARWLDFLNSTAPPGVAFPPEFGEAMYRRSADLPDPFALRSIAAQWIRGHRGPS